MPLEKEMATHSTCLGNPTDRGAWQAIIHRVAELNMMTGLNMHACSADLRRLAPALPFPDIETLN